MAVQNDSRQNINVAEINVDEKSAFVVFMNVVITLTHILVGAIAFNAIFFANIFDFRNSFEQHIYLCVIGVSDTLIYFKV